MRWIVLLCLLALPASAEPWIRYNSGGGIAGMFMNLTIDSQGKVHYQEKRSPSRTATLTEAEMEALRQAIPTPFPDQPKREGPVVPDGISSGLKVGQDKVEWGTGSPVPEELYPLLEQLQKIRTRLSDQ